MAFLPGGPNRKFLENPCLVAVFLFLLLFLLFLHEPASSRGAEISLVVIRAELVASVEKSPSSTKGVRANMQPNLAPHHATKRHQRYCIAHGSVDGTRPALAQIRRSQA